MILYQEENHAYCSVLQQISWITYDIMDEVCLTYKLN